MRSRLDSARLDATITRPARWEAGKTGVVGRPWLSLAVSCRVRALARSDSSALRITDKRQRRKGRGGGGGGRGRGSEKTTTEETESRTKEARERKEDWEPGRAARGGTSPPDILFGSPEQRPSISIHPSIHPWACCWPFPFALQSLLDRASAYRRPSMSTVPPCIIRMPIQTALSNVYHTTPCPGEETAAFFSSNHGLGRGPSLSTSQHRFCLVHGRRGSVPWSSSNSLPPSGGPPVEPRVPPPLLCLREGPICIDVALHCIASTSLNV